ncbi:toll/interleukin-1 receptor domain-containing protein [uncultured Rhodoblastus sp.]|uniref:toll/interleukin-1 receptor domain-containing protein n=1 Tax=uncultured Rhodoblastus sp. TaxID=543037 RepID=UPI0025FF998F|nr:toll/interleukin-1 receptor domain-containing protein [uncultured Rhodoblastus sp.]
MSRIFLSHSSKDDFSAVAVRDWLGEEGWNDVFLDLDPAQGIHPGQRWERALYEQASRCEAVIFLVSNNWLNSDWCRNEYELARRLNKRVFVVLIENIPHGDLPDYLKQTFQAVSFASGEDPHIQRGAAGHAGGAPRHFFA